MTRENREKLQREILQIVSSAEPWHLYLHYDFCGGFGDKIEYVYFSAKGISPYVAKKLGFAVRKDIIKHALKPLAKDNSLFIVKKVY